MSELKAVTRKTIITGFGWSYAERMLAQVVSFVVSIILARLLAPEAYGTLSMVNIFISIASSIALTGFGSALIQKKEADNLDFSSALFFSFGISVLTYILLFISAPLIAVFFSENTLVTIIRVMSISVIISSINTVQHAHVIRNMKFRLLFISTLIGSIISAVIGISMAYMGYGVWALVAQYMSSSIVNVIVLELIGDWRPEISFSISRIKTIYSFGWKIMIAAVADAVYRQSRSLAIGKKYTAADLAFYDKGLQFPNLLITNIDTTIANVLMPAISSVQDDRLQVKELVRRSVKTSSVILFPLLIGMSACAESFILILLTEKWIACVPYMQLLCIALMMKPIQTANFQGVLAIGRSDVYLRIQMLQKISGVIILLITIFCFNSVLAIAIGEVVAYILFALINIVPNCKYLDYSIKEQLSDILPQMILALLMGALVNALSILSLPVWLTLVLQIIIGGIIYLVALRLLKLDCFMYLFCTVKRLIANHRIGTLCKHKK